MTGNDSLEDLLDIPAFSAPAGGLKPWRGSELQFLAGAGRRYGSFVGRLEAPRFGSHGRRLRRSRLGDAVESFRSDG